MPKKDKNNKKEEVEETEEVEEPKEGDEKEQPKIQLVTTEQMMLLKFDEINSGLAILNQKIDKILSLAEEEE